MRVRFAAAARRELDDAVDWYEQRRPGLGARLREEVGRVAQAIQANPHGWPFERDPLRKHLLNRFPYKLLYVIDDDVVLVLAVAHQRRQPRYWADRWPE